MIFSSNNLSSEEVKLAYNSLRNRNLTYSKLQSDRVILYAKWLGLFLGAGFLILIIFGRKSSLPIVNWLLVVALGISTLVFFFTIMPQSFENDKEMQRCLKIGKELEEKYPLITRSRYFHSFGDNHFYWALLFGRIAPIAILNVIIAGIGTYLSVEYSLSLGIGIILLSIAIAIWAMNFLMKKIKEIKY